MRVMPAIFLPIGFLKSSGFAYNLQQGLQLNRSLSKKFLNIIRQKQILRCQLGLLSRVWHFEISSQLRIFNRLDNHS